MYSKLHHKNLIYFTLITTILALNSPLYSVSIELGKEGESYSIEVDKFNNKQVAPSTSTSIKYPIKNVSTSTPVKMPDFIEKLIKKTPIIFIEADKTDNTSKQPVSMNTILQVGQSGEISVTGKGSKEIIALSDGTFDLQVYLSTYNRAFMKVSLYDIDGSEIWFKGQSLLFWERSDDKQNDPLSFKGLVDQNSMYKENNNDYSPTLGLSYKVDIKDGQKIVITTGGNALSKSYAKIKGNCF